MIRFATLLLPLAAAAPASAGFTDLNYAMLLTGSKASESECVLRDDARDCMANNGCSAKHGAKMPPAKKTENENMITTDSGCVTKCGN